MAQPPKKRPRQFIPSEQDKRRAAELARRAEELGQPTVAAIVGVSIRTLQRYIKLQRSMKAQEADRFEQHFGKVSSVETQGNGHRATDDADLERVLARHELELSYSQVKRARGLHASGLRLSEEQWEQLVLAMLAGRTASP